MLQMPELRGLREMSYAPQPMGTGGNACSFLIEKGVFDLKRHGSLGEWRFLHCVRRVWCARCGAAYPDYHDKGVGV